MLSDLDILFYHSIPLGDREEWLFERTACDKSLFYFIKQMGGFTRDSGGDVSSIIHKPVCDFWQNPNIKRKADFMPRIWRKSTCLTKWGNIHSYLLNNETRILIPSQKIELSSGFLDWMERQVLSHERLRWLYPILQQVDQQWRKKHRFSSTECELPRQYIYSEPTFRVVGVTGASQSGHYDIINPDDLIGEKGVESPTVMEDAFRWFDNVEELLVEPDYEKENGSIVRLVGTHWCSGDLGCYVQEKYPEYKWMITPCLKDTELIDTDNITWHQDPNAEHGESNWPEKFSTQYYLNMRSNPEKEMVFWAQQMNNPSKATGIFNKFDLSWVRFFEFDEREDGTVLVCDPDIDEDGKPKPSEEFSMKNIPLYGMIDPGGFSEVKLMKKGSRNAVLIGGQAWDSRKKFIVYTWCGKLKKPSQFIDEVFKAHDAFNPNLWRIDPCGQQGYIYKDILEARERRGKHLPITQLPYSNKKDEKDDDIQACMNPMANGEIYLHRSMKSLLTEIKDYPQGLTVDLLDMLGKLNKHYWTRKKKEDYREGQKDRRYDLIRQRGIAGY